VTTRNITEVVKVLQTSGLLGLDLILPHSFLLGSTGEKRIHEQAPHHDDLKENFLQQIPQNTSQRVLIELTCASSCAWTQGVTSFSILHDGVPIH
jgi:hypothetical protein